MKKVFPTRTTNSRVDKLRRSIFLSFLLTLAIVSFGTALSVYQNWEVRVESSKTELIRSAEVGNLLVENALIDAAKSLDITQRALEAAMQDGDVSQQRAYDIIMKSLEDFSAYNHSKVLGLVLWVDANGLLFARSGEFPTNASNFSDRYYYLELKNNQRKQKSIGPLMLASANGEWVFHLSIPVHDSHGLFAGVLVQQILEADIANELQRYIDPSDFSKMMTHANGNPVTFQYPAPTSKLIPASYFSHELTKRILESQQLKGNEFWAQKDAQKNEQSIIGYARSPIFGLTTLVALPIQTLVVSFLEANYVLFAYFAIGVTFLAAIFYYLYQISLLLLKAKDNALHDPLTLLSNRRALDENLPQLLREAMRSQHPISILFIDIDFFRKFNERYGHESGDVALQVVANSLANCCRRPLDFICRWGGEEFVAVLPHTNELAAQKIASDMLQAVRSIRLENLKNKEECITVSVGIVTSIVTEKSQKNNLVDTADKAMQHAKELGRNQAFTYQPGLENQHLILGVATK